MLAAVLLALTAQAPAPQADVEHTGTLLKTERGNWELRTDRELFLVGPDDKNRRLLVFLNENVGKRVTLTARPGYFGIGNHRALLVTGYREKPPPRAEPETPP